MAVGVAGRFAATVLSRTLKANLQPATIAMDAHSSSPSITLHPSSRWYLPFGQLTYDSILPPTLITYPRSNPNSINQSSRIRSIPSVKLCSQSWSQGPSHCTGLRKKQTGEETGYGCEQLRQQKVKNNDKIDIDIDIYRYRAVFRYKQLVSEQRAQEPEVGPWTSPYHLSGTGLRRSARIDSSSLHSCFRP